MASIETRESAGKPTKYLVSWRQDGKSRFATFDGRDQAVRFRGKADVNGQPDPPDQETPAALDFTVEQWAARPIKSRLMAVPTGHATTATTARTRSSRRWVTCTSTTSPRSSRAAERGGKVTERSNALEDRSR